MEDHLVNVLNTIFCNKLHHHIKYIPGFYQAKHTKTIKATIFKHNCFTSKEQNLNNMYFISHFRNSLKQINRTNFHTHINKTFHFKITKSFYCQRLLFKIFSFKNHPCTYIHNPCTFITYHFNYLYVYKSKIKSNIKYQTSNSSFKKTK